MSNHSQVVLITGCSSGIGQALALALLERGCRVYASARKPETLAPITQQGGRALQLDVTDTASIARAVAEVMADAGRIDVLVNNAGQNLFGPLAEVPLESVRRLLDTNVTGLLAVTQAVFPHMAKARHGLIVNIGSVVGLLPTPFAGTYCATKAAVHMLSEVLRVEAEPLGIDVLVVQPGGVRSSIAENGSADLSRYEQPSSIYYAARAGISRRANASQRNAVTAEDFAREVATAILSPKGLRVVRAGRGARVYPALANMPVRVRDKLLKRMFSLDAL
jgi:NADP-dependent 3-hydroxy acid dehydrogenase YdfG